MAPCKYPVVPCGALQYFAVSCKYRVVPYGHAGRRILRPPSRAAPHAVRSGRLPRVVQCRSIAVPCRTVPHRAAPPPRAQWMASASARRTTSPARATAPARAAESRSLAAASSARSPTSSIGWHARPRSCECAPPPALHSEPAQLPEYHVREYPVMARVPCSRWLVRVPRRAADGLGRAAGSWMPMRSPAASPRRCPP
jgi:hypothetical protein